jgi:hypothetical protein
MIPSRDLPDLVLIRKCLSVVAVAVTVRGSLKMDGTGVSFFFHMLLWPGKKVQVQKDVYLNQSCPEYT